MSAFTHLWNPIGFPDIFYDEGVYLRRALHVLDGLGPQEYASYYDHPFFGQLFLASVFKIIEYPNSLNPSHDLNSIKNLYVVPRVIMGILAVIDTFLIYKITELRYNRNAAFLASVLFAVMPMSWLTRRVLLDNILLPFLLASILFAVYSRYKIDNTLKDKHSNNKKKFNHRILYVILSGIFLGLAVFTKIPVFVYIPLIAYIIFVNSNRRWKLIGLWFVPVILIPLVWPAYSVVVDHFDDWINTIVAQTQREGVPPLDTLNRLLKLDPILFILGTAGSVFAFIRRDLFIILWAIPSILFHFLMGYYPDREFIPMLPLFCIGGAVLIDYGVNRIKTRKKPILLAGIISAVGVFGLISTTMLISTNLTSSQFATAAFISAYLDNENNKKENITLISTPIYSWIFKYVYDKDNILPEYRTILFQGIKTDRILLVADQHFNKGGSNEKLRMIYNSTGIIAGFNGTRKDIDTRYYPYTSMLLNNEGLHEIEIRKGNYSKLGP